MRGKSFVIMVGSAPPPEHFRHFVYPAAPAAGTFPVFPAPGRRADGHSRHTWHPVATPAIERPLDILILLV